MPEPRVLFAGTPAFASVSLAALLDAGIRPLAVLTQPDRPAGRGRRLTASPVKQTALAAGLDVLQPATLRGDDIVGSLARHAPDLLIVAAYGLILPQAVLDVPARACVNVHASLLPRWRGAAPVQAAIAAGDAESGISLMQMTAGLDCGPVYAREAIAIGARETAGTLHDRLAGLGGDALVRHLPAILDGTLEATPQNEAAATYAGKISRADARIDWHRDAVDLDRFVRAYDPVPGAWFDCGGEAVKVWQAEPVAATAAPPGSVVDAAEAVVATGSGCLRLDCVQRPGRGRVSGREFAATLALDGRVLPSPGG